MNQRQRDLAVLAIDRKIGIEREDCVALMDLGHSHNAGIGQRHWSIEVFLVQFSQRRQMLSDLKCDSQRAFLEESEKRLLCHWSREEIHCLSKHRLADE